MLHSIKYYKNINQHLRTRPVIHDARQVVDFALELLLGLLLRLLLGVGLVVGERVGHYFGAEVGRVGLEGRGGLCVRHVPHQDGVLVADFLEATGQLRKRRRGWGWVVSIAQADSQRGIS